MVLHDPDGLLVLEEEDVSLSMALAVDQVRQRRVTGEWLVNRAIARGHVAEAVQWYLRFGLEPVVRLLRVEHCPWRHDFGLRYLRKDLPPDLADRVEELVPGVTSASLEELSSAATPGWTSCWTRDPDPGTELRPRPRSTARRSSSRAAPRLSSRGR